MDLQEFYTQSLLESAEVKQRTIQACKQDVADAIEMITAAYRQQRKVLFCGNGGSAADCQHLATELMIRLNHAVTRPALAALSLCTDASLATAGGNDIGFENVFARTVQGLGQEGDILIAISTSGKSKNVMLALDMARSKNMKSIGLLGNDGGPMRNLCDIAIVVPSDNTQRIQETHITLGHIVCESVEQQLYPMTNGK